MAELPLENGETVIDTWFLNYLPSSGGRYAGKLAVSDQSVYFTAQFEIKMQHDAVQPIEGGLRFARRDIVRVEKQKKFWIFQRVLITLRDGSVHTFDRGAMSVEPILGALGGAR